MYILLEVIIAQMNAFFIFCRFYCSFPILFPGEGRLQCKVMGVIVLPVRVNICGLVPLRVLKSKMTSTRCMVVYCLGY